MSRLEKEILYVLEPLRYLRTCLACARCPLDGLDEYLARMLVIGAISGLVDVASQLSDPTMDWNFCVRYCCLEEGLSVFLILSTGRLDLYGDCSVEMWS